MLTAEPRLQDCLNGYAARVRAKQRKLPTDRVTADIQRDLDATEQQFRAVAETAADAINSMDCHWIIREIVTAHGGSIALESAPGNGAQFTVTLEVPMQLALQAETILVVDDDNGLRDTLKDVLSDEGYEVALAKDGAEALEYLRSQPAPSVILLDWMMPRCNGAAFRAAQKKDPSISNIPVVLFTADRRIGEQLELTDAAAYLKKPVQLEELFAVLERHRRHAPPKI